MAAAEGHAATSPKPRLAAQIQGHWAGLLLAASAALLVLFAQDNPLLSGRGSWRYLNKAWQGTASTEPTRALAVAREPAAGSSFRELLAADPALAGICSSSFRAENAAKVQAGDPPWLMTSDCGLGQCDSGFTDSVIDSARSRPALAGLLDMVPCDLFKTIEGRTTWILGDRSVRGSCHFLQGLPACMPMVCTPPCAPAVTCRLPTCSQSQRFFTAARCFLDPFLDMESMKNSERKRVYVTNDTQESEVRSSLGPNSGTNGLV